MLRKRGRGPSVRDCNSDDAAMTLPLHQSLSADGSIASPQRRRRVKRVRRLMMLGVSCLSVLVLVSTGRVQVFVPWHLFGASSRSESVEDSSAERHLQEPHHGHRHFPASHEMRREREPSSQGASIRTAPSPQASSHATPSPVSVNRSQVVEPPRHQGAVNPSPFNLTQSGNSSMAFVCSNENMGVHNDNYCDCPDGSDEVLTSACSHLLVARAVFRCDEESDTFIYTSRVGDGVVDCPNGSDERKSPGVAWS